MLKRTSCLRNIYMLELLVACLLILGLILISEGLWKRKKISTEVSRKIIHMGTGIIVAFMPLFIPYFWIQLLSVAFLAVIFVSYRLRIFQSIHAVKRVTVGEFLYPIAIGVCAFIEPAPWIFTAAILHLAIADSMAAIFGQKWGKRTRYMIITHGKSLVGSLAFFLTSAGIFLGVTFFVMQQNLPSLPVLLGVIPLALVLLENVSLFGSDDITIPVAVIVLLSVLPT
jgi:phytol kinase